MNGAGPTVYVSSADSGELTVLRLAPRTGTLQTLQVLPVGGMLMPLALRPDRRVLFAARRSEPLAVASFAIAADGTLAALGEAALPHSMANIALDGSGRWLLAASYGGHLVSVSPVEADGRAGPARQVVDGIANAHTIRTDPANRVALAASLGSDRVLSFRFDAASGRLTAAGEWAARRGSGPRHLVFDPQLPVVYLLGELDAGVDVLDLDPRTGALSLRQTVLAWPPLPDAAPWAADLRLTPDGRFLYASERRSGTLAAFAVDRRDGSLAPCGRWETQPQPRGFAIDPTGCFLVAAGQTSHRLTVHRIDASSGALTACSEHAVGAGPNWIEMA